MNYTYTPQTQEVIKACYSSSEHFNIILIALTLSISLYLFGFSTLEEAYKKGKYDTEGKLDPKTKIMWKFIQYSMLTIILCLLAISLNLYFSL